MLASKFILILVASLSLVSFVAPTVTAVTTSTLIFKVYGTGNIPINRALVYVCRDYIKQPVGVYGTCNYGGNTNSSGLLTLSNVVGTRFWYIIEVQTLQAGTISSMGTGQIWIPAGSTNYLLTVEYAFLSV